MTDVTELDGIVPIPNIGHPSDGDNLHYQHTIAVLLYNILMELRRHKTILEQIRDAP